MFYDEKQAMDACKDNPMLIFDFIKLGYKGLVDKILAKEIADVNMKDETNTDVVSCLLIRNWNDLALKYMKKKHWNVNNQNNDGNTFAHILVTKRYLDVYQIVEVLLKKEELIPNLRNKKGETILDRSINNNYISITAKILSDERFNNIDLVSFKNLYENYIKNDNYGKYSKISNLEIIVDNLQEKKLRPNMKKLLSLIVANYEVIKDEVKNNNISFLDTLVNNYIDNVIS